MTDLQALVSQGTENLRRLHSITSDLGYRVTEVDWEVPGVGFGIFLPSGRFGTVSQEFGDWNIVYVTAGIVRDMPSIEPELLLATNRLTRGNPLFPVFVHEGETCDVLTQTKLPLTVLEQDRDFLSIVLQGLSNWVDQVFSNLPQTPGSPYASGDEDRVRLVLRSLT